MDSQSMSSELALCTICARGNSKGVPNKNLSTINGKPLLAYSISHAKETGLFQDIAVSSDSPEILEVAKRCGATLLVPRPDAMATDTAAKLPSIRHCFLEAERIGNVTYSYSVDLDATSPLRRSEDIIGAVDLLKVSGARNVITGAASRRSPYFNMVEENGFPFVQLSKTMNPPAVRRQDVPRSFDLNASIYVWTRQSLIEDHHVIGPKTALYEMPESRSHDIDSPLDFEIVEFILSKRKG